MRERELRLQAEGLGRHPVKPRSIRAANATRDEVARLKILNAAEPPNERPQTRGECDGGPRPCPMVSCKYNMYLQVNPETGTMRVQFPDLLPEQIPPDHSCVLDIADRGPHSLEYIGSLMNMTREAIRQIEVKALKRALASKESAALATFVGQPPMHRPTPLAEAMNQSSRGNESESDDNDEQAREYVPPLPHILDSTVSDEQYIEAIHRIWERWRQRRALAIQQSDTSIQPASKSDGRSKSRGTLDGRHP